jgi:glutamate racemase
MVFVLNHVSATATAFLCSGVGGFNTARTFTALSPQQGVDYCSRTANA